MSNLGSLVTKEQFHISLSDTSFKQSFQFHLQPIHDMHVGEFRTGVPMDSARNLGGVNDDKSHQSAFPSTVLSTV
ncbi:hypothetical protein TNCT_128311 [Trichonephila clavata]|uniref:Uncharacterized protein n=1 Tax=Trichonephila clavata TaxID=2740835 RepID=A0A8X6KCH2_TRICU|nr:hypothetical protein TNCT_128311 [Trichonephila clavata]